MLCEIRYIYRRYVRIPYIRVNEGSLIQRDICNIPLVYSAVSTYNVTWQNKAMVQLFVYTPLIRGLATRQNSPSLRNGSRHGEKAQSKLLFMWRIEHEELQKQKITEQPGFVPPSRLGTNHSERIARSGYGDQRAHGSQTSKIQCCKH